MSELHGGAGAGGGSQDDDSLGEQRRTGLGWLGRSVLEVWAMIQITPQDADLAGGRACGFS